MGVGMERIGRYKIQRFLIQTAFSRLYLAEDEALGRLVVVKRFAVDPDKPEPPLTRDQWLERFLQEGRVMAGLDHPNILGAYELRRPDGDDPYLVLPFMRANLPRLIGFDLRPEDLDKAPEIERPRALPVPMALHVLRQVAGALTYLHGRKLVHRDIKPSNILLVTKETGSVKLCDFGMVRASRERDLPLGSWIGTPDYMAPEQAADAAAATDRSDVYGAAMLGFRMMVGRLAAAGDPPLDQLVPKAGAALSDLLARGLDPDPGKRPTAFELLKGLAQAA
jgi:serine/threonine-protein kinase